MNRFVWVLALYCGVLCGYEEKPRPEQVREQAPGIDMPAGAFAAAAAERSAAAAGYDVYWLSEGRVGLFVRRDGGFATVDSPLRSEFPGTAGGLSTGRPFVSSRSVPDLLRTAVGFAPEPLYPAGERDSFRSPEAVFRGTDTFAGTGELPPPLPGRFSAGGVLLPAAALPAAAEQQTVFRRGASGRKFPVF